MFLTGPGANPDILYIAKLTGARAFRSRDARPASVSGAGGRRRNPVAGRPSQATGVSAEITEREFYLKAITPRLQAEVKPGDVVQAGVVISNSEVGHGTLKIEPLLYYLVCTSASGPGGSRSGRSAESC